jgi:prolyl-tRNA synthetase
VKVDDRDDLRPGFKFADWELRGVPVRVEVGPRDLDASQVTIVRRDGGEKAAVSIDAAGETLVVLMSEIQQALFVDALGFREAHTVRVGSLAELGAAIADPGGFVITGWCGDAACEAKVKEQTKATLRFLPLEQQDPGLPCAVCGHSGAEEAAWAVAY